MRRQAIWGAVIAAPFFFAPPTAAQTCDFGEPADGAPPEAHQFDFLIGNYHIEARSWNDGAWSDGYLDAEWNGRWGIGGRAVVDEWSGPKISPDRPRNYGVNVRYYDPARGLWEMVWQATNGTSSILEAQLGDDGNLAMWQVTPEPTQDRYIYFEIYDEHHWARIEGTINEDGTRVPRYKLEAHEAPCES